MQVIAESKFIRVSPKKVRETAHAVTGLNPRVALDRLTFSGSHAARVLMKVITAALANATNNSKLAATTLKIDHIEVGKGPFFKRWNPVSRGMVHAIKKRTSHIRVVLSAPADANPQKADLPKAPAKVEEKQVVATNKSVAKEKKK